VKWRELKDAMPGPARQQAQDVANIGPKLDVEHAEAPKQLDEESVGPGSVIASGKEPVLAAKGLAARVARVADAPS
jgi:hypothetical protein